MQAHQQSEARGRGGDESECDAAGIAALRSDSSCCETAPIPSALQSAQKQRETETVSAPVITLHKGMPFSADPRALPPQSDSRTEWVRCPSKGNGTQHERGARRPSQQQPHSFKHCTQPRPRWLLYNTLSWGLTARFSDSWQIRKCTNL